MSLNLASLNVRGLRDTNECARLIGELSNLSVNVAVVQETNFICAANAWVLEDDFVVLSALDGHYRSGVSLLIGRSLNTDVDLVFSGVGFG